MGYHSSPLVTFVLTLLNVRLGAWLGNPGPAGDKTFQLGYPKLSVRPIIAEAFGLTDDCNPYVYLSDGGHFENLGLYEMVLRRCHYIVVSDAGQDPLCSFSDLGGAVRKIRIDLGIPIDFGPMSIFARSNKKSQNTRGRSCAIGKILYSAWMAPALTMASDLYQTGLLRRGAAGYLRILQEQRPLPAREHGRPVFQRIAIRELSNARGLHDRETLLEQDR